MNIKIFFYILLLAILFVDSIIGESTANANIRDFAKRYNITIDKSGNVQIDNKQKVEKLRESERENVKAFNFIAWSGFLSVIGIIMARYYLRELVIAHKIKIRHTLFGRIVKRIVN